MNFYIHQTKSIQTFTLTFKAHIFRIIQVYVIIHGLCALQLWREIATQIMCPYLKGLMYISFLSEESQNLDVCQINKCHPIEKHLETTGKYYHLVPLLVV